MRVSWQREVSVASIVGESRWSYLMRGYGSVDKEEDDDEEENP